MKVLKLTAYYPPENIPSAVMQKDLETAFTESGIDTKIITPYPTRGCDEDTYKSYRGTEILHGGHVEIYRFPLQRESKRTIFRAWRYLCGHVKQYHYAKKEKDIDIVLAGTTPPTQIRLARKVAKKLKKPYVLRIQDVFPDSMVTSGMTKEGSLIYKIGESLMKKAYADAAKIMVIGDGMKETLVKKGVPEDKIVVISNWIDTDEIAPISKEDNKLFEQFLIPKDKFIVLYAGNFGAAQGADVVISAAERLKDNSNIHFVIFGGGAEFDKAKSEVMDKGLTNVTINALLPPDRISEVYSIGDVALITCKKGIGNSGMPSKTWSIMACNTPIIAAFDTDSELAEIINSASAGVCIEPGNAELLADEIIKASKSAGKCNSRDYIMANASKEKCVAKYVEVLISQTER